jgi:hypothetical protein
MLNQQASRIAPDTKESDNTHPCAPVAPLEDRENTKETLLSLHYQAHRLATSPALDLHPMARMTTRPFTNAV